MSKIINDPVHGFINIKFDLALRCIDHPYFQRLRNISQLGLTDLVYPGATHSRFIHALGAFHLMQSAIEELRKKNIQISHEEEEAACMAILLHDIGHGPFSHTLEHSFFQSLGHEDISLALMKKMNEEMNGALDLTIQIFTNQYDKRFFYQLISSQLDMDRMDYLKRDSFYSGVKEGNIAVDRILAMMDVKDNQIVIHEKGILSVQHFLMSRNLMYWQVYLHKTVLSGEYMLIKLFERIYHVIESKIEVQSGIQRLDYFLNLSTKEREQLSDDVLMNFVNLSDSDILCGIKNLTDHSDSILSFLARGVLSRKFYKVYFSKDEYIEKTQQYHLINEEFQSYYYFSKKITMTAYSSDNPVYILTKKNKVVTYEDYIARSGMITPLENQSEKEFYFCME